MPIGTSYVTVTTKSGLIPMQSLPVPVRTGTGGRSGGPIGIQSNRCSAARNFQCDQTKQSTNIQSLSNKTQPVTPMVALAGQTAEIKTASASLLLWSNRASKVGNAVRAESRMRWLSLIFFGSFFYQEKKEHPIRG